MKAYDDIVEILIENTGISRDKLFEKSGIRNRRDFIHKMDELIANHRVIKEYDPEFCKFRYSPKILLICEHEKSSNSKLREHIINFIPTKELEKILDYTNRGTEQEDCLEFELQIMGYRVEEKYKTVVEDHTGLSLNFDKYHYYLWAKFLDPFIN